MRSTAPSHRHATVWPAATLVSLLTACASSTPYVYTPDQASVAVDGLPGARAAVPPERPEGDVRVASYGLTQITPAKDASAITTLHVRMVVSNNNDTAPWQIDTQQQQVFIAGEGQSNPLYVNTDVPNSLPLVSVAPRERRTIDFYFPLPATVGSEQQLPAFDFLWSVQTPERTVADRTQFARQEVQDTTAVSEVTVVPGWGPWWWYNPFYPTAVFLHPRPIVIRDHTGTPGLRLAPRHWSYVGRPGGRYRR